MIFSIIIPVKAINNYIRETIPYIQNLKSSEWELIILPNNDDVDEWNDSRIRIIPTGRIGPAAKRDIGAKYALGEILVFLDDDSYPKEDLLSVASPYFHQADVIAIGGPAITPSNDSYWQKVSGAVFLSKFSGGAPERYVPVGGVRKIDDWPTVNFMVRKDEFLEIGGFSSPYWPGEDTKLCLDLLQKVGGTILYIPDLHVWHHRRAGFFAHLKQIGAYGIHRGYFAKVYPQTSRKFLYFIPSFFCIYVILSLFYFIYPESIRSLLQLGWLIYIIAMVKVYLDMRRYETLRVSLVALGYVFFTQFWYGIRFIQGLMTGKLVSRLR